MVTTEVAIMRYSTLTILLAAAIPVLSCITPNRACAAPIGEASEEQLQRSLEQELGSLNLAERASQLGSLLRDVWRFEVTSSEDRSITIGKIATGALVFVLGLLFARGFTHWFGPRVLNRARVDEGAAHAYQSLGYYALLAIAFITALRIVDIPLTAFAVVGGALAIGVGFGSQNVVNNFISGLILLAERPIKAGDWIIAGNHEGIVRKISVRSTEIETIDRANVVVPNSVLISESVKNWTLHNNTGRVTIPIGVHYDSDPELVRDILLEVAKENSQVMSNPAPFVYFENFADNSLNFILYVYLSNINVSLSARTNLRIGILKAFREHGIEIPYPQRDIHLSEVKWLKEALDRRSRGNGRQKQDANVIKPDLPPPASSEDLGELG